MKHNIPCEMVKDLIPLYIDQLTSDETNREIEKHFDQCPSCKALHEKMRQGQLGGKEKETENDNVEINYLKTIRKNNRKKVLLGMVSVLLLLAVSLGVKFYIIGYQTEAYDLASIEKQGDQVICTGEFDNQLATYKNYKITTEENGENRVVVYARLESFWSSDHTFHLKIDLDDLATDVNLQGNTIQMDGTVISKLANDLYNAKNPYLGNISADLNIASILEISTNLGAFKNQLQTANRPYGWTLNFEDPKSNKTEFEGTMKNYACVFMALIDNIGEVHWNYNIETGEDLVATEGGITEKQCSAYVGDSIKTFSQSPEKIQELLDFLGIRI